jgi:hydroxyacylglutathione hydrolase
MITIKRFVFNPIQENTYILYDETHECVIIDPGFHSDEEKERLDQFISKRGLKPVRLVNTHCHFDHILGVNHCREKYQLLWEIHQEDAFLVEYAPIQANLFGMSMPPIQPADHYLKEDDEITFGNSALRLIHVPGHSPGSLVMHSPTQQFILVGDVLFCQSIGRTDLPKGNHHMLIQGIKNKLLPLDPNTKIYSGHGPASTIELQKKHNPFL